MRERSQEDKDNLAQTGRGTHLINGGGGGANETKVQHINSHKWKTFQDIGNNIRQDRLSNQKELRQTVWPDGSRQFTFPCVSGTPSCDWWQTCGDCLLVGKEVETSLIPKEIKKSHCLSTHRNMTWKIPQYTITCNTSQYRDTPLQTVELRSLVALGANWEMGQRKVPVEVGSGSERNSVTKTSQS